MCLCGVFRMALVCHTFQSWDGASDLWLILPIYYQNMCMGNYSNPQAAEWTCWMLSKVLWCKVLGIDWNDRPVLYYIVFYCPLYCLLLSTGFTVMKLYYVSILFYYASVFDSPKYRNFILLYVMAESISSLSLAVRDQRTDRTSVGSEYFLCFGTPERWEQLTWVQSCCRVFTCELTSDRESTY